MWTCLMALGGFIGVCGWQLQQQKCVQVFFFSVSENCFDHLREPAGKPVKVVQISPEMLTQPLRLIRHICWKVFMRTPGSHLNAGSTSSVLLKNTSSYFWSLLFWSHRGTVWVLANTSNRVRLKHLCHFVSSWSYKGIYSAILKLSVFILYIWNHCSSCIKMPPLQKKRKKNVLNHQAQKQMWHRSKDVLNNESFWKESSSCATENDQFWRISGTMAPAVLASERSKQRSLRCSFTSLVSVTTRGKQRVAILLLPGAWSRGPKPWHLSRGASS